MLGNIEVDKKTVRGFDVLLEKMSDRDVWHIVLPQFQRADLKPVYWMGFDEQEARSIYDAVTGLVIRKLMLAEQAGKRFHKLQHEADMLIVRRGKTERKQGQ